MGIPSPSRIVDILLIPQTRNREIGYSSERSRLFDLAAFILVASD
jgi:hypothetical protein